MKSTDNCQMSCRHCCYFIPEGRRGGQCQRLSAPVESHWGVCSLALPPFAPSWETLENIMVWHQPAITLDSQLNLEVNYIEAENMTFERKNLSVL
ncbi:MAG: hypothetical protein ACRDB1_06490 [Microcoleaceae cyanobacterium]